MWVTYTMAWVCGIALWKSFFFTVVDVIVTFTIYEDNICFYNLCSCIFLFWFLSVCLFELFLFWFGCDVWYLEGKI